MNKPATVVLLAIFAVALERISRPKPADGFMCFGATGSFAGLDFSTLRDEA